MKKFMSSCLVAFVAVLLASSADAQSQRRRAVAHPSIPPTVQVVILVRPSPTVPDGWVVQALSLDRVPAGTTWIGSVRKPKEISFTPLPRRSVTIPPALANLYLMMQLWNGEWADDGDQTLSPPVTSTLPWGTGVATFKVEVTSPEGVRTSVLADVLVGDSNPSVGPIEDAKVSSDGKMIFLTPKGPFSSPVALLDYRTVSVVGNQIAVPKGVWGVDLLLVVCSEYPVSYCWTGLRSIPQPQN